MQGTQYAKHAHEGLISKKEMIERQGAMDFKNPMGAIHTKQKLHQSMAGLDFYVED